MKKILAFCLTLFALGGLYAVDPVAMPRLTIPTARSAGMGGTHVAYTDNVFSLLVNPAAMMRVRQKSVFALSPAVMNPQTLSTLVGALTGGDLVSGLGDVAETLSKRNGRMALGFDLREFPLAVAWVADGFGFGLWNRIYVNPNIIGIRVEANVLVDVMLPVGFAFKILDIDYHSVDAGFVVKPFTRAMAAHKMRITDMVGNSDGLFDNMTMPLIAGAGLDLGFIYRWDLNFFERDLGRFSAGLTFNDVVTRGSKVMDFADSLKSDSGNDGGAKASSYYVPFSMGLGIAYDFKIGEFWTAAPKFLAETGITFAFDWRDVPNAFMQDDYTRRNAVLDLGMGLQLNMLKVINLRLGMSEMLPAWGIGFDLGAFELNFAYYGRELGLEPGQLPAANVDLTIAVRPGAKKRDWPWTRGSLVGLFTKNKE